MRITATCVLIISLSILPFDPLAAAEWGNLSGRIVYTGTIPKVELLEITRDEEVCGQHQLVDESLVVNPKDRGLQNVVVWLSSKKTVPVHPSFAENTKPAKLDNHNCRFVPRIVTLRTGQMLLSTNSDPVAHNVAVYGRRNTPFSEVIPNDSPLKKTFSREELVPIRVDCSIHAWMRAYLMITEHPYAAVTDKHGRFSISNVPAGTWQFKFWHEKVGCLPVISNGDKEVELSRGGWDIDISGPDVILDQLSVSQLEDE
ncbi:MAG: hypothetical protein RIK87_00620 [Fuerstiella sp.]